MRKKAIHIEIMRRDLRLRIRDYNPIKLLVAADDHGQLIASEVTPLRSCAGGARRGGVVVYSARSRQRLRLTLRNAKDDYSQFISLTYPAQFPADGKTVKSHLNTFLQALRRQGIRYTWALEFQKRQAPHFHILSTGHLCHTWVMYTWHRIVGTPDYNHLMYGADIRDVGSEDDRNQCISYMLQYMGKEEQKRVPEWFQNVGRFWGCSRQTLETKTDIFLASENRVGKYTRTLRRWYRGKIKEWGLRRRRMPVMRGMVMWWGRAIWERLTHGDSLKGSFLVLDAISQRGA